MIIVYHILHSIRSSTTFAIITKKNVFILSRPLSKGAYEIILKIIIVL